MKAHLLPLGYSTGSSETNLKLLPLNSFRTAGHRHLLARTARWVLLSAALGGATATPARAAEECVQCPSGLVAWWPGKDATANLAGTDDATLQNGASFAPGEVGSAFGFDGGDDHVQVGSQHLLALSNNFTVWAWIFPTDPGTPTCGGIIVNKEGEYETARHPNGIIQWTLTPVTIQVATLNANTL